MKHKLTHIDTKAMISICPETHKPKNTDRLLLLEQLLNAGWTVALQHHSFLDHSGNWILTGGHVLPIGTPLIKVLKAAVAASKANRRSGLIVIQPMSPAGRDEDGCLIDSWHHYVIPKVWHESLAHIYQERGKRVQEILDAVMSE